MPTLQRVTNLSTFCQLLSANHSYLDKYPLWKEGTSNFVKGCEDLDPTPQLNELNTYHAAAYQERGFAHAHSKKDWCSSMDLGNGITVHAPGRPPPTLTHLPWGLFCFVTTQLRTTQVTSATFTLKVNLPSESSFTRPVTPPRQVSNQWGQPAISQRASTPWHGFLFKRAHARTHHPSLPHRSHGSQ
jgi:hypothetical protein